MLSLPPPLFLYCSFFKFYRKGDTEEQRGILRLIKIKQESSLCLDLCLRMVCSLKSIRRETEGHRGIVLISYQSLLEILSLPPSLFVYCSFIELHRT